MACYYVDECCYKLLVWKMYLLPKRMNTNHVLSHSIIQHTQDRMSPIKYILNAHPLLNTYLLESLERTFPTVGDEASARCIGLGKLVSLNIPIYEIQSIVE